MSVAAFLPGPSVCRRVLLLFCALFLLSYSTLSAQSSQITTDTTWTAADSPHRISGWFTVKSGATLTIEPGAVIYFGPLGSSLQSNIVVESGASIVANGTTALPITLSAEDGVPGKWAYIRLDDGSSGSFRNCLIEYGGQAGNGVLDINSSNVTVSDCTIQHISGIGLRVNAAAITPTVENVTLSDCSSHAIQITQPTASPVLSNLSATLCGTNGIYWPVATTTANITFNDAGIPYVLSGWADYQSGSTVTVEPGAEIRFSALGWSLQGNIRMRSGSQLICTGTSEKRIRFTHHSATPAPGGWAYVLIDDGATATFSHTDFEYGGQSGYGSLRINSSNVTVSNCTFTHSSNDGIYIEGAGISPTLSDIICDSNGRYGMNLRSAGEAPAITNATITNSGGYAIYYYNPNITPIYTNLSVSGNGEDAIQVELSAITSPVRYDAGVDYHVYGWGDIASGASVTVAPGSRIFFGPIGWSLQSNFNAKPGGSFTAEGTADQPILFSFKSDAPTPGKWPHLQFQDGSSGRLDHCILEYAQTALNIQTSDFIARNCVVRNCSGNGVTLKPTALTPVLENFDIQNCGSSAVLQEAMNQQPTYRNFTASGNATNGIYIGAGARSSVITRDTTWYHSGIPIIFEGWGSVGDGATLTVEPGTTIRFPSIWTALQGHIKVQSGGRLVAEGEESNRIRFTHHSDTPTSGGWAYLLMEAGSSASFVHCDIEYGGNYGTGNLLIRSSDVVVDNCTISSGSTDGIFIDGEGVSPTLTNLVLRDNARRGLHMNKAGEDPIVTNVQCIRNREYAVYMVDPNCVPTWTNLSVSGNGSNAIYLGLNSIYRSIVLNAGVDYHLFGWGTIQDGASVTLVPGTKVYFGPVWTALQSNFVAQAGASMIAEGTEEQPILISFLSDNPRAGGWPYLWFNDGSRGRFEHCTLEYADRAFDVRTGDFIARNCTIRHCASNGIQFRHGSGVPVIENVVLSQNTGSAIYMDSANAQVSFSGLEGDRNGTDSIYVVAKPITSDITWTNCGLPYLFNGWGEIRQGGSLTLEPGANLWFDPLGWALQGNFVVKSGGRLIAKGSPFEPVVFSPRMDTMSQSPWAYLWFEAGSEGDLQFCDVRGAGSPLRIYSSAVTVSNSKIYDHSGDAVIVEANAQPFLRLNQFENCAYGVRNRTPATVVDARQSWWGSVSGPYHADLNPDGTGLTVSDGVAFEPWATSPTETEGREATTVAAGAVLEGELQHLALRDFVVHVDNDWQNILVRLTPLTGDGDWQLLGRFNGYPSVGENDWQSFQRGAARELIVPAPINGDYYFSIYYSDFTQPDPPAGTYRVEVLDVGRYLVGIARPRGGTGGLLTQTVYGAGFVAGMKVQLRTAGGSSLQEFTPGSFTNSVLTVPMNLGMHAPQVVDVAAVWPDSGALVLEDAFEIVTGKGAELKARLTAASAVRPNRVSTMWLEYENAGDADMPAPLFIIRNTDNAKMRLSPEDPYHTGDLQALGVNPEAPVGILPPGASNRIPVYYIAENGNSVRFALESAVLNSTAINWDSSKEDLRPDYIPVAEWDGYWDTVKAALGSTWSAYHAMLVANAKQLMARPQDGFDVNYLVNFEINSVLQTYPVAATSGRLYHAGTRSILAGAVVKVLSSDQQKVVAAVTDREGRFLIGDLGDGTYSLECDNYIIDPPMTVVIQSQQDDLGLVVYAKDIPPVEQAPEDIKGDTTPELATNGAGEAMMLWLHGSQLRSASWSAGAWQKMKSLDVVGVNPDVAYGPSLLGEGVPGYIASWEAVTEEGERVLHMSLGQITADGIEWTVPVSATTDGAEDFYPALAVLPNGDPMAVWVQKDLAANDDSDLYFLTNPNLGGTRMKEKPAAEENALALADTDCFEFTVGAGTAIPFVMQPILGKSYEFNLAGSKCNTIPTCSGTGESVGGSMTVNLGDTLSVQGEMTGSAEYGLRKNPCTYVFKKMSIGVTGTIKGEIDKPIPVLFLAIPIGTFYPNVHVGGSAGGSLEWVGHSGGMPTGGQVTFSPFGGGGGAFFAAGTKESNGLVAGTANLDISGTFSWKPDAGLNFDGFCVKVVGEAQIFYGYGKRKVTSQWGKGCGKALYPMGKTLAVTDTRMFRTAVTGQGDNLQIVTVEDTLNLFTGTGAVHEGTAVLGSIGTDLYDDGKPSIATSAAGETLLVWRKNSGDYANELGSRVVVASYNSGTGTFDTPVVITPDAAFNEEPVVAFGSDGNPMVVWSQASSAGLTGSSSISDVATATETSELWFSRRDGADWTAPAALTSMGGSNVNPAIAATTNGIVVLWQHMVDDDSVIHAARWAGSAWSAPVALSRSTMATDPEVIANNSGFLAVWSQDGDGDAATPLDQVLRYVTSGDGATWSAAAALPNDFFVDPQITAKSVQKSAAPRKLPPIPDGCCGPKCPPRCPPKPKPDPPEPRGGHGGPTVGIIRPRDPNEKVGPAGWGGAHVIQPGETLSYTIFFENVATASAPAQEVFITDSLDENLDWSTLRVTEVVWGSTSVTIPPDSAEVAERVSINDHRTDVDKTWWVDIDSGVDPQTGTFRCNFHTLDPDTEELPEDALAGFLPPNDDSGRGQGHVSFTVQLKADAPADLSFTLKNKARIVFDTENVIETNEYQNLVGDPAAVRAGILSVLIGDTESGGDLAPYDMNRDNAIDASDLDP